MNIKQCWACHTGVKFQPITNSRGDIIATHSICRSLSCPMNQQDLTAIKLKQRKSIKSFKSVKRTTRRKSRFISGAVVGISSLMLTVYALTSYANFQLPSSELNYTAQTASSTAPQSSKIDVGHTESVEMVSTTTVKEYVLEQAKIAGVHVAKVDHMAEHESHYNTKAVGDMNITCERTGKPVRARGIFQITECFHPEVSDEQAFDYKWATAWALNIIAHSKKDCISQWATCASWYSKT